MLRNRRFLSDCSLFAMSVVDFKQTVDSISIRRESEEDLGRNINAEWRGGWSEVTGVMLGYYMVGWSSGKDACVLILVFLVCVNSVQ